MRQLLTIAVCLLCMAVNGQTRKPKKSHMRDSVALGDVTVTGKSKTQKLRRPEHQRHVGQLRALLY